MIEKYFISNCLFLIDEFNDRYANLTKEELKVISDTEYTEADIVVRLGYPFKHMATFNMQGTSKESGSDILVKSKDFRIEVKLPRNYKSGNKNKTSCSSSNWNEMQKDFEWLFSEIKQGKKGQRAFIIGWFNAVDRFSQIVQLGKSRGKYPEINQDRFQYFPFLNVKTEMPETIYKTKDIIYQWTDAYKELTVRIPGYVDESVNCMFFGKPTDKFLIAMYY